jgi:hypothetical protein
MTPKGSEHVRGTHSLEAAIAGVNQDLNTKLASEHTHQLEIEEGGISQDAESKAMKD